MRAVCGPIINLIIEGSRDLQIPPLFLILPLLLISANTRCYLNTCTMSYDRLNSLEAQPTTMRRDEDPQYRDDPDFDRLAVQLSDQLFELTSNITRLSNQIALLGTKRDTERVRERVHNYLEETRTGFRDVGEGIKRLQTWEDVNVLHI